jgi:hypothetical protein
MIAGPKQLPASRSCASPLWIAIRTRNGVSVVHGSILSARCVSSAVATASDARANAATHLNLTTESSVLSGG